MLCGSHQAVFVCVVLWRALDRERIVRIRMFVVSHVHDCVFALCLCVALCFLDNCARVVAFSLIVFTGRR